MSPISKQLDDLAPLAIALLAAAACSDQPAPTGPSSAAGPPAVSPALAGTAPGSIALDAIDLGNVAGAFVGDMHPMAINESGLVVGYVYDQASSTAIAFAWRDGQFAGLAPGGDYTGFGASTVATGVNDVGQVVARSGMYPDTRTFVARNGVKTDLAVPDGGVDAVGYEINDAGQVVGGFRDGSSGAFNALLWTPDGAAHPLGTLGGDGARALAINNRGDIAAERSFTGGDGGQAVLVQGAVVRALGSLGGRSLPNAINELGEVAGEATNSRGQLAAFLWQPGWATMRELTLDGFAHGKAVALNELGQVVGAVVDASGVSHAALWQDGDLYLLGDVAGLRPSSEARDINNQGQVVGSEPDAAEKRHLVRWTVPLGARVDVAPGDASNAIALGGKGIVTVAVLTTPFFDASRVSPASLILGNADANDTPVMVKRDGSPSIVFKDVDRDGDQDLVAQFDKDVLKQKGDLTTATTRLVLRGQLQNGKQIRGSNAVTVSP